VGVPLSLWWRKSGNLIVNDTAHALLEGVRNGLAGAGCSNESGELSLTLSMNGIPANFPG
jgi:hypothetical protein